MAEEILIKVKADTSEFTPSIKAVEQLGQAAEKDVKAFNTLDKAIKEGVNKGIKDAAVQMKAFMDAGGKAVSGTAKEFVSLRQKIKEARDEASAFADQNSKGAIEAQKRLADLIEQQSDLNQRVAALNPEAKFQAFSQVTQGAIGSLQVLTGALQAFGVENEQVTKIAQQLQGVLNLSQGINSILGLGDALKNLRVVLGITTVAQTGLAAATTAEGVAATGAAAANTAFAASLSATGIGALVVAIGLLVAAFIDAKNSAEDADAALKALDDRFKGIAEADAKEINDVVNARVRGLEQQRDLLEAQGAKASELLTIEKQITEIKIRGVNEFIGRFGTELQYTQRLIELKNEQAILEAKIFKARNEEILKSRPADASFLPTKDDVKLELSSLADVIAPEIEQLSSEMPAIEIPIGITQEDLDKLAESFNIAQEFATQFFDIYRGMSEAETEQRIDDLDRQKEAGVLSQEQYAMAVKKVRNEQAKQSRDLAIFEAAINAAVAIVNALKTDPTGLLAIKTGILAALQVAAINARPLPQFKDGTLRVPGVDMGRDSVHALLQPGESVMPVKVTKDYFPVLETIYNRRIPPAVMNNFIKEQRTSRVKLNPYDMRYAMDGMGIKVKNADYIINGISKNIRSHNRAANKYK